jgi:hypothetical protein
MRRLTPIPHHRRHQTVGVRRVELGIRAVRTASAMAVRPKHASSGQPRPFILRVGAAPSQFDRAEGASSDQKHKRPRIFMIGTMDTQTWEPCRRRWMP